MSIGADHCCLITMACMDAKRHAIAGTKTRTKQFEAAAWTVTRSLDCKATQQGSTQAYKGNRTFPRVHPVQFRTASSNLKLHIKALGPSL